MSIFVLLPLIIMVILLLMKKHMLVAGVCGAVVAMVFFKIGVPKATQIVSDTIPGMLGMVTPVLYSATAIALSKTGGFEALLGLSRKIVGKRLYLVAAAIVLIQALATYAAGLGAGNTMVTGPLAFSVVGAVPQLIAAMAIGTAASFITSPSSAESATLSKIAGIDVSTYVQQMFPFTVAFWVLAMGLAAYGVWKKGSLLNKEGNVEMPLGTMLRKATAPIYFIIVVVAGKYLNMALGGFHLFTPIFNIVSTLMLSIIMTKTSMDRVSEDLVQGSAFILTRLFAIGLFLGFINILSEIGTFKYIAQLTAIAPSFIYVPAAIITAFLVAVPAGAYSVGVITLIMPVLAEVGLTPIQMGMVAMAIGMGTQMSPVQINVASLSQTFQMEIQQVVKNNAPYVVGMLVIITVLGFFV